jgi:hypothetical protein
MTPEQKQSFINKALQLREMLLTAEYIEDIRVDGKKLEHFQTQVKNDKGRQGCNNNFKSLLRREGFIFFDEVKKTYRWNKDMDGKFDLIIKCAKESQEILIKSNQRKMQQDTIHEPMLFDSVMREQDQSTVTLKLSPEQFEQLKKHHQLLTTILTTTNQ